MDDALRPVIADLQRWLAQERAAGRERVFLDEDVRAAARDHARVASPSLPEPSADTLPAPKAPAVSSEAPQPAPRPASAAADDDGAPLPPARVRRDEEVVARKAAALAELDTRQVSVCTKCALSQSRTNTVFGVGHPDADLMFVGEAPGADEDAQGEPFVGRAGKLLTKILGAIGFEREDVFIANVLKCRPPGNRDPLPDEVGHCEPYLLEQIRIIEPKVICALGRVSAQTLLQTRQSLGKMRGQVHDYHGVPMVVTFHPAALLRNPAWKRPTWEDVRRLRALYDELTASG